MFTFIVIAILFVIWVGVHSKYTQTGLWKWRRLRSAYAWAMIGGIAGSFVGVAGFGGAIIGTIPGAILGFLFASNLMKQDREH